MNDDTDEEPVVRAKVLPNTEFDAEPILEQDGEEKKVSPKKKA